MVRIRRLVWNDWNVKDIKKHKVTVKEVEEVSQSETKSLKSYQGRLLVLGRTKNNRLLTVVLVPEGKDKYYVVTARDMSQKERRYYQNDQV